MKTYIKQMFLLLAITLFFASCQDEVVQIGQPNNEEVIEPGSALSNLMRQASANRTSNDNFLDNTSCFSVELPVTVIIGNITLVIENEEGLDELEELLEEFEGEIPEFVFPITLVSANFEETVIENEEQLEALIENCIDDDIIECVDFVYPISFSVLNTNFVIVETVTIENNEALYEFLEALEDSDGADLVSLNFPVDLIYSNGDTITVNSNIELTNAINTADDDCDGDEEVCDGEEIRNNLKTCKWEIEEYTSFPEFEGIEFLFNDDFSFVIIIDGQVVTDNDTWEIIETANEIFLVIDTDFEDLGGDWLVVECDDDDYTLTKNDQTMVIEKYCEGDLNCSAEDLAEDIIECYWFAGTTLLNTDDNKLVFTVNGEVKVFISNDFVVIGTWNIGLEAGVLSLVLNLEGDYASLSGTWEVIECDEGFYGLMNNDNVLHLEQECFDDDVFECYPEDGVELIECASNGNNTATFNIYEAVPNCDTTQPVSISFHTTLVGAENGTDILENATAYESNTQTVYVKVALFNNQDENLIYPVELVVEDCTSNVFQCFESFDAIIELCDENNDGIETFDLTIAFANCSPEADSVSYYESLQDAESGVNPIANPEAYTNSISPQTIYVRVEIENEVEIFELIIKVQDCTSTSCTEGDVDGILMECEWKISSFNGDDHLINYRLDFISIQEVVITNLDTNETITASWSTSTNNQGNVEVVFDGVSAPNIQAITGTWEIVECTSEQLVLHDVDNSNNEMVMDRICE